MDTVSPGSRPSMFGKVTVAGGSMIHPDGSMSIRMDGMVLPGSLP